MDNLFLRATLEHFRFPSNKGDMTVEDLWEMPLQSKTGFDLDTVAKTINRQVKESSEESFVQPANNSKRDLAAAKLEVVKTIIAYKVDENEKARTQKERAAMRKQLEEILEKKQGEALLNLSETEIRDRIEALK